MMPRGSKNHTEVLKQFMILWKGNEKAIHRNPLNNAEFHRIFL
jgi:hypothetical protein